MGFFKDFKDDFSEAVNELMPQEGDFAEDEEDIEVNTIGEDIDIEQEMSKLDALLEDVSAETEKSAAKAPAEPPVAAQAAETPKPQEPEPVSAPEKPEPIKAEQEPEATAPKEDSTTDKKTEENTMDVLESITSTEDFAPAPKAAVTADEEIDSVVKTDENTIITGGTKISGNIESTGSLEIEGHVTGDVKCNGKLTVTGTLLGNSSAAEFYADTSKIEGEILATGTVKVGMGSVIIGNVTATSAVIAGAIKGDIDVQGPVVVDSSAVVVGNIKSKSVQINNGAVIEGFCSQCYSDIDMDTLFDKEK